MKRQLRLQYKHEREPQQQRTYARQRQRWPVPLHPFFRCQYCAGPQAAVSNQDRPSCLSIESPREEERTIAWEVPCQARSLASCRPPCNCELAHRAVFVRARQPTHMREAGSGGGPYRDRASCC